MRILLVDDDSAVLDWARLVLREDGHSTDAAKTSTEGQALARSLPYDLAIVDLDLPDGSGLALVLALRAAGQELPIIMLTGRDEDDVTVACLDAGADDYLVKPVTNAVLRARVRAATRRGGARRTEQLVFGGIFLDRLKRQARVGDRTLDLSPREFALLEHLLLHPGEVVSRSDLLSAVWGVRGDPHTNMVDATASRLRQKLTTAASVAQLVAVRGMGYTLQQGESTEA